VVCDILKVYPAIAAIVDDRALDRDYRTDGWRNAPVNVYDEDNVFQPTLVVTKEEGVRPLGAPYNARRELIAVWAFGSDSDDGYTAVQAILELSNAVLAASPEIAAIPGGNCPRFPARAGG
jgi:hypothetical protein